MNVSANALSTNVLGTNVIGGDTDVLSADMDLAKLLGLDTGEGDAGTVAPIRVAKRVFNPQDHRVISAPLITTTNTKEIAGLEPFNAIPDRRPQPAPRHWQRNADVAEEILDEMFPPAPRPWQRNADAPEEILEAMAPPAPGHWARNVQNGAQHAPPAQNRPWQRQGGARDVAPAADAKPMTEDDFWGLIGQCHWANKDDGRMGSVGHIKKLSQEKYGQFMEHYDRIYDGLKVILDASRVFAIRGITNNLEIRKVVSHVIGLGKESYMTIMTGENTFVEYFIDAGQCVSLDALL